MNDLRTAILEQLKTNVRTGEKVTAYELAFQLTKQRSFCVPRVESVHHEYVSGTGDRIKTERVVERVVREHDVEQTIKRAKKDNDPRFAPVHSVVVFSIGEVVHRDRYWFYCEAAKR